MSPIFYSDSCIGETGDSPCETTMLLEQGSHHVAKLEESQDQIPQRTTVCHIFEQIVLMQANAVAVECGDEFLTYQQLHDASNAFADRLLSNGIFKGEVIPLLTQRSPEMVVALLAIMKTGACVVPMDLDSWGSDRITTTMGVIEPRIFVSTSKKSIPRQGNISFQSSDLSDILASWRSEHTEKDKIGPSPSGDDLAYIIFTSGTTAEPKGVMIAHRSMAHYVSQNRLDAPFNLGATPGSRILLVFSVAFDACLGVLFSTLCNGGTLVLASSENYAQVAARCTILPLTPTILATLTPGPEYDCVQSIFLGGETPAPNILQRWDNGTRRIFNCYGPTETTCTSLIKELLPHAPPTLEHPVAQSTILIVNEQLEPSPSGEILISGPGLATGYFKNETLTREKFIMLDQVRFYRTGDYGRVTSDGIAFVGRRDRSTKNRGFLINLESDVEYPISQLPGVKSAAALMHRGHLVVFLTPQSLNSVALRETLLQTRDSFLVPDLLFPVYSLPQTPNGKVDLDVLRDTLLEEQGGQDTSSRDMSNLSLVLQGLHTVLAVPLSTLSSTSSFVSLGGNSLAAVTLVAYLRERSLSLSVRQLFELDVAQLICNALTPFPAVDAPGPDADDVDGDDAASIRRAVEKSGGVGLVPDMHTSRMSHIQMKMLQSTLILPSINYIQISMTLDHMECGFGFSSEAFRQAWGVIYKRHSILRSSFILDIETAVVENEVDLDWNESFTGPDDWDSAVATTEGKMFDVLHPLDAQQTRPHSMMRLVTEPNKRTQFIWIVHHSIVDGWSLSVIIQELQAILSKETLPAAPQFAAAVRAQKQLQQSSSEGVDFWLAKIESHRPISPLSLQLPSPMGVTTDQRGEKRRRLGVSYREIHEYAQKNRVSDMSLYLAAWGITLSRYINSECVIVGAVLSGRNLPISGADKVVGPMLNTLPIPLQIRPRQKVKDLLDTIHATLHNVNELQWQLAAKLLAARNLFDTLVSLQYDLPESSSTSPRWRVRHTETTEFPLHILIDSIDGKLTARFLFDGSIFDAPIVSRILDHFVNTTRALLRRETVESVTSSMMGQIEINDLLFSSRHLYDVYRGAASLKDAFEAAVDTWPELVAIEDASGSTVKYQEIENMANAVASKLSGVAGPGDVVGVFADGSIEWIIAILGILKTGAAYCPVDAGLPLERITIILKESRSLAWICTSRGTVPPSIQEVGLPLLAVDEILSQPKKVCKRLSTTASMHDAAAVIFTSGSTGVPKGIVLEHIGILSLLDFPNARHHSRPGRRNAQLLSFGFDCCVNEIFATLCYGATLVLKDPLNPSHHLGLVHATMCTPSYLSTLSPDEFPNLELIALAGEKVPQKLVDTWGPGRVLLNVYSPSECTISAVYPQLWPGKRVTLGLPVPRMAMYVLDQHLLPVPIGVTGEIYLSGIQVTQGYLNNAEETAARFLANPFIRGWKMYRSGDLGRLTAPGEIEYLGRVDHQVKVRGYRVELEEVETAIVSLCPEVEQAVAVVVRDALFAAVTPRWVDLLSIQHRISRRLPPYSRPSAMLALASIPVTANQKADRRKIAAMQFQPDTERSVVLPVTATERIIRKIWRDLLLGAAGAHPIGALDDFSQLGGHSLLYQKVARELSMLLDERIQLRVVMQHQILRDLASAIDGILLGHPVTAPESCRRLSVVPVPAPTLAPAGNPAAETSHLEREMYLVYRLASAPSAWNVSYAARLGGDNNNNSGGRRDNINDSNSAVAAADLHRLEQSIALVLQSNVILRARYTTVQGQLVRTISSTATTIVTQQVDDALPLVFEYVSRPFDLAKEPPFKVYIFRESPTRACLVIIMSHMIGDRATLQAIVQQIGDNYMRLMTGSSGWELGSSALDTEYSRWAQWRNTQRPSPKTAEFWTSFLAACHPDHPLFADFSLERTQGTHRRLHLDGDLTAALRTLRSQFAVTGHQLVTAAVGLTMAWISQRGQIIISAPFRDSSAMELGDTIGPFLDRVPIPLAFGPGSLDSIASLLTMVKSSSEQATANYVPFVDLKSILGLSGMANSLCEIVVTYHVSAFEGLAIPGMKIIDIPVRSCGAKFPLMLEFTELPDGIQLDLEYDARVMSHESIELIEGRLLDNFRSFVQGKSPRDMFSGSLVSLSFTTTRPARCNERQAQQDASQERIDLVRGAMAQCLGLKQTDISCTRSFFELGASSIDCLRLQQLLLVEGVPVSLGGIFELQTAESIARVGA